MLNYVSMYPNPYSGTFNDEILLGIQDDSIADYVVMEMMELEAIDNIKILDIKIVTDQDEVDINQHMININYKKKDMSSIEIPKYKYVSDGRYGEFLLDRHSRGSGGPALCLQPGQESKTVFRRHADDAEDRGSHTQVR